MSTNKLLKQLQKNQLTKLNLSGKTLTLARTQILFEAITHSACNLKKLDLSHCEMADAEKEKIFILLAQGLQRNESLTEVNLTFNFDFSSKVTDALVQALRLNRSLISFCVNLKSLSSERLHNVIKRELQTNDMLHEKDMNYSPEFFSNSSPTVSRKITSDHTTATSFHTFLQPCP